MDGFRDSKIGDRIQVNGNDVLLVADTSNRHYRLSVDMLDYGSEVSQLTADISSLSSDVSTVEGLLSSVSNSISTLNAWKNAHFAFDVESGTDLDVSHADITLAVQEEIPLIEGSLNTLSQSLQTIQAQVTTLQQSLDAISSKVSLLEKGFPHRDYDSVNAVTINPPVISVKIGQTREFAVYFWGDSGGTLYVYSSNTAVCTIAKVSDFANGRHEKGVISVTGVSAGSCYIRVLALSGMTPGFATVFVK